MSKKLLLADDSITIQKVIGIIFSHEDYDLTVVGDGDSALEKARAERPDLVLADVFMPGKNGYELCAALKGDPQLQGMPVLLLTGTFEPFDEAKAAAAGADSWIAKPFESQALIDRVEELLAHSAAVLPEHEYSVAAEPTPPAVPPEEDVWSDFSGLEPVAEGQDALPPEEDPRAVEPSPADFPLAPPAEGDDIWQSLGEELPAAEEEDAFILEVEEEPPLAVADPFAEASFPEELALPGEEVDAAAELSSAFDEEAPEEGVADPWSIAPEEDKETEALWDTFDDEEILALDEDDILEDDLDLLEDEELLEVASEMEEPEEDALPAELSLPEDSWDEEPEIASAGQEPFMSDAAADFLAAEAEELEEFSAAVSLPEDEEPLIPPVVESFNDADYAFSLEDLPAEPSPEQGEPEGAEGAPAPAFVPSVLETAPAPCALSQETAERQVAALSEDEIARIVEKLAASVIERLAETMLERIAWEVVPDLAESMIREEIRKIREEAQ